MSVGLGLHNYTMEHDHVLQWQLQRQNKFTHELV